LEFQLLAVSDGVWLSFSATGTATTMETRASQKLGMREKRILTGNVSSMSSNCLNQIQVMYVDAMKLNSGR
jgi:hypothetical protein